MKKKLLLIGLLANFSIICQCVGQHNVIKIDGFGAVLGRLNLSYERSLNRHFSASLQLEGGRFGNETFNNEEIYRMVGYGIIPELRYYPFTKNRPAPLGYFVGGAFRYAFLEEQYLLNGIYSPGSVYSLGLCTGYKFNYRKFIFEFLLGLGEGVTRGFNEKEREDLDPIYKDNHSFYVGTWRQFPRIEVSIGFVFPKIKIEKNRNNNG